MTPKHQTVIMIKRKIPTPGAIARETYENNRGYTDAWGAVAERMRAMFQAWRHLELDEIKKMDQGALEAELKNRVYAAAIFLEQLENAGHIYGNGHHKAQDVAEFAAKKMRDSWSVTHER